MTLAWPMPPHGGSFDTALKGLGQRKSASPVPLSSQVDLPIPYMQEKDTATCGRNCWSLGSE